jgi:hypothetical protein
MSAQNLRRSVPLGLAVLGLAAAPAANAAGTAIKVGKHSGDRATLSLSSARKHSLKQDHVRVQTLRPASNYRFPQASGKWNFTSESGTLNYSGAFRFRDGKRSVRITRLSFVRTAKGKDSVTGYIAGHKVTLFTLSGKAKVKKQGTRVTISGLTAKLTKAAAQRLNKALHHKVANRNQKVGSFTATFTNTTKAKTTPTKPGAPAGPATSEVGLSFNKAVDQVLSSNGLPAVPILPATGGLPAPLGSTTLPGDGTSVTLPSTGSGSGATLTDSGGTITGTLPLSGGIQLGSGAGAITLSDGQLTLGTGTDGSGLSFSVNGGPDLKLFDIDTSKLLRATTSNGSLSLSGLTAELSKEGADTINQLVGKNIVQPKEVVGGLSLIVPASSGSS